MASKLVEEATEQKNIELLRQIGLDLKNQFIRGDAIIGIMSEVDAKEANMVDVFARAASLGDAESWLELGRCHIAWLHPEGAFEGVSPENRNYPWAKSRDVAIEASEDTAIGLGLRCFAEAAKAGNFEGARLFAVFSRGEPDATRRAAIALLEPFASRHPEALYRQALVYIWLEEATRSVALLENAAAQGHADSMFELFVLHQQGLGVSKSSGAANSWLLQAAEKKQHRALFNLGAFHATGANGFAVDYARSSAYYEESARYGNGRAAANLAVMHLDGTHPAARVDQAIHWLERAEATGYDPSEMLDICGLEDPRRAGD